MLDDFWAFVFEYGGVGFGVTGGGNEVLPYEHTEFVTVVVPAVGFDFDVFADGVEAHVFDDVDIVGEGAVSRGGVDTVWPVALVEDAEVKEVLVVEEDAGATGVVWF